MEAKLEHTISNLMSQPDVVGVLCTDSNGLCLAAQGKVPERSSGYARSLAIKGKEMATNGETPTVSVEIGNTKMLVTTDQNDEITVAVFKNK